MHKNIWNIINQIKKYQQIVEASPDGSFVRHKRGEACIYYGIQRVDPINGRRHEEYVDLDEAAAKEQPYLVRNFSKEKVKALLAELKRRDPAAVKQIKKEIKRQAKEHQRHQQAIATGQKMAGKKKHPQNLIHLTLQHGYVRSKSEAIIATILSIYHVKSEYEKPLLCKKSSCIIRPDFTIEANGRIYYLEHLGKMDDADYNASWQRKLQIYRQEGIVPEVNLIITQDHQGGIDLYEIMEALRRHQIIPATL